MVWPPTLTAASPVGASDHHLVGDQVLEAAQQRRFAGAGAPGDEQVARALAQVVMGGEDTRAVGSTPAGQASVRSIGAASIGGNGG